MMFQRLRYSGNKRAINSQKRGTKCAAVFRLTVPAGAQTTIKCRLHRSNTAPSPVAIFGKRFNDIFNMRRQENDEFYRAVSFGIFIMA